MAKSILFVANFDKEHISKFHIPTIRALKDAGWKVDVACAGIDDIPFCDCRYRMSWSRSPFSPKLFIGLRELSKILKISHYDIIYCHTPVGGLAARLVGRKYRRNGTKIVYFSHGFHFFKSAPILNWVVFFPVEKYLSSFTDYLFTINEEDYSLARRFRMFKKGIFKFPGVGVNWERLHLHSPDTQRDSIRSELGFKNNDIVLVYIAEINPNKNQQKLIDVIKILNKTSNQHFRLLLIGPEHDNGACKAYSEQSEYSDDIVFTGWRDDIGALLHASDICVASSIREGFGINLVEAMACGKPVVAFENRGHKEIIENGVNGYLVRMNDCKAMADKIVRVIDQYDFMSENAKASCEQYDAEMVARQLCDTLERINDEL